MFTLLKFKNSVSHVSTAYCAVQKRLGNYCEMFPAAHPKTYRPTKVASTRALQKTEILRQDANFSHKTR